MKKNYLFLIFVGMLSAVSALACPDGSGYCVNDQGMVMGHPGKILEIYADRTAKFEFADGSGGLWGLNYIVPAVSSLNNWHKGQRAALYGYSGTILEVYANGWAWFQFDDGSSGIHELSKLVAAIERSN